MTFSSLQSTIFAVLAVLSCMLFGGSLYELGVASPVSLLQKILFIPSWISPLRWSYELFYLIAIQPYRQFMVDPNHLGYAYVLYGFSLHRIPQAWWTLVLLVYVFRMLPFLALVAKEKY